MELQGSGTHHETARETEFTKMTRYEVLRNQEIV